MTPPPTVTGELESVTQARSIKQPRLRGMVETVMASSFIWIFFWLAVVDFSLVSFKPLKNVGMGGYIQSDKNPLRIKLEKLLSPACNPDICVIGSSLTMSALACADSLVYHKPFPTIGYGLHSYHQSLYLEEKLAPISGRRPSVFNISISGCMASDAYAILRKCLEIKPSIKTVVLMMSPRDVADNAAARDAEKSTVIQNLRDRFEPIDLKQLFTTQSMLERALSKFWQYFYQRADYKTLLRLFSCETFDRAADLHSASHRLKPQEQDRLHFGSNRGSANDVWNAEMKRNDAKAFVARYNPYDRELLTMQFEYLERSLALCKARNVVPIVVDLPVPAMNRNVMPRQLKDDYMRSLTSLCRAQNVHLVELQESSDFNDNDFRDTLHPVGTGGKKIIDALSRSVSQNPSMVQKLKL